MLEVGVAAVTEMTDNAQDLRDCAHTSARHLSTQTVIKPWLSFLEQWCPYLNSGKWEVSQMWSCGFWSFVSFILTSMACWHESKEECWAWQSGSRPLPPLGVFSCISWLADCHLTHLGCHQNPYLRKWGNQGFEELLVPGLCCSQKV